MIAELLEDPEALVFLAFVCAGVVWFALRWMHRGHVVETEAVRSLGGVAGLRSYLVSAPGGRRYETLEYEEEGDEGNVSEIEVVFSPRQAAALATHLEVAAFPHASLAYARAATRRARASREKSPQPTSR